MPFTLSHPAAAIPLARGRMVLSALVVGSLAPDFHYAIPLFHLHNFAHTLPGVFGFCVPAGLLFLWLFHHFLKLPLLSLLPRSHQSRLLPLASGFRFGPWPRFGWILISLAAGAITHNVWDLITHSENWFIYHLPFLRSHAFGVRSVDDMVYYLLQGGSSVAGALLLVYWYVKWYNRAPAIPVHSLPEWPALLKWGITLSIGLGAFGLAGLMVFLRQPAIPNIYSFLHFAEKTGIVATWLMTLAVLAFSAIWHVLLVKEPQKAR